MRLESGVLVQMPHKTAWMSSRLASCHRIRAGSVSSVHQNLSTAPWMLLYIKIKKNIRHEPKDLHVCPAVSDILVFCNS